MLLGPEGSRAALRIAASGFACVLEKSPKCMKHSHRALDNAVEALSMLIYFYPFSFSFVSFQVRVCTYAWSCVLQSSHVHNPFVAARTGLCSASAERATSSFLWSLLCFHTSSGLPPRLPRLRLHTPTACLMWTLLAHTVLKLFSAFCLALSMTRNFNCFLPPTRPLEKDPYLIPKTETHQRAAYVCVLRGRKLKLMQS